MISQTQVPGTWSLRRAPHPFSHVYSDGNSITQAPVATSMTADGLQAIITGSEPRRNPARYRASRPQPTSRPRSNQTICTCMPHVTCKTTLCVLYNAAVCEPMKLGALASLGCSPEEHPSRHK